MTKVSGDTVAIPRTLLEKFESSIEVFTELHDELESFLLAQNPVFLKKMRQARKEHRQGKVHPLSKIKTELCIE